jgi:hypothetical protein
VSMKQAANVALLWMTECDGFFFFVTIWVKFIYLLQKKQKRTWHDQLSVLFCWMCMQEFLSLSAEG